MLEVYLVVDLRECSQPAKSASAAAVRLCVVIEIDESVAEKFGLSRNLQRVLCYRRDLLF